jgi:hypothetical protein
MVQAIINIKMGIIIMVIGKMIIVMDKGLCITTMALHMLEDGKKVNSMEMGYLHFRMRTVIMGNG